MLDICIGSIKDDLSAQITELEKFTKDYNLIINQEQKCASYNRNRCIEKCTNDIIICMDDDLSGFYEGWIDDMIRPLNIPLGSTTVTSARFFKRPGVYQTMMGYGQTLSGEGYVTIKDNRIPSSCIAFKRDHVLKLIENNNPPMQNNKPFDENYLKAEWEDVDFAIAMVRTNGGYAIVNNNCKLIHYDEEKWRDESIRGKNREYFQRKWGIIP